MSGPRLAVEGLDDILRQDGVPLGKGDYLGDLGLVDA
jgi:hypothetical protein